MEKPDDVPCGSSHITPQRLRRLVHCAAQPQRASRRIVYIFEMYRYSFEMSAKNYMYERPSITGLHRRTLPRTTAAARPPAARGRAPSRRNGATRVHARRQPKPSQTHRGAWGQHVRPRSIGTTRSARSKSTAGTSAQISAAPSLVVLRAVSQCIAAAPASQSRARQQVSLRQRCGYSALGVHLLPLPSGILRLGGCPGRGRLLHLQGLQPVEAIADCVCSAAGQVL